MNMTTTVERIKTTSERPSKPCLKLASSSSAFAGLAKKLESVHAAPTLPKNDSLDDVSSNVSSCCSYSYASSLDSSMSDSDSRKSVSFADSIGEDLCHVKLFCKELCEYDELEGESWPSKLWRWQMYPSEESEWYVGGGGGNDDEDIEHFDLNDLALVGDVDYLEDVLEEDEEDDTDIEDVPEPFSLQQSASLTSLTSLTSTNVIVPTFLCPVDLPSYSERLSEHGMSLESVSVTEHSLISGTVRLSEDKIEEEVEVTLRFSTDSWATSEVLATTAFGQGRFGFVIDAKGMEVGDDIEIVVAAVFGEEEEEAVDDNRGLKYRFICKKRPKFQPGKKLW
jgi:hypothetical protein